MEIEINVKKQVEAKTLKVKAGVGYWEDARVDRVEDEAGDLMPCRDGNIWCPLIDIDSGVITNWEEGVVADIHYKVCDRFGCEVLDSDGNIVFEYNGYVPSFMSPKENGYGDYIIMDIDFDGKIKNWKFNFSDISEY